MEYKNISDFVNKNKVEGFFVNNKTYEGFEDNNNIFIIKEGVPVETNINEKNLQKVAKENVYFKSKNKRMVMSEDSRSGFLYQEKDTNKISIWKSPETIEIETILFEKNKVYSKDRKNRIKEIDIEDFNKLTHYTCNETDSEIKEDKQLALNVAIKRQKTKTKKYNEEMIKKSNSSGFKLKR